MAFEHHHLLLSHLVHLTTQACLKVFFTHINSHRLVDNNTLAKEMDFPDSPDIPIHGHGSRLLSLESPLLPSDSSSSSRMGPGADDLSLSELSLVEHNMLLSKPFSLLAPPEPDVKTPTRKPAAHTSISREEIDKPPDENEGHDEVDSDEARLQASAKRQEKLQSDIFVLKKLNAAFESFNDTLEATGTANEVPNFPLIALILLM